MLGRLRTVEPGLVMGVGVGLVMLYGLLNRQKAPLTNTVTEDEEEEKVYSMKEDDIIEKQSSKKLAKGPTEKQSKKKNLQQKINQMTKKAFVTDVESEMPRQMKFRQLAKSEKNKNDKLFFQLYSKVAQEASNEDLS